MSRSGTPKKRIFRIKNMTTAELERVSEALSREEEMRDESYWPPAKQVRQTGNRLTIVLQKGQQLQQQGSIMRSGNIAYKLKEILQMVDDLEKLIKPNTESQDEVQVAVTQMPANHLSLKAEA